MKKVLTVVTLGMCLFVTGCSNPSDAIRALSNSGYTNIDAGGFDWFGCGNGDFYSTKFVATNPAGKVVSGTVCSGLLKGATVRF